jgi:hypothetical protein
MEFRMNVESRYLIEGRIYRGDSPALQEALSAAYRRGERPRCLCVEGGVEMYVANHAQFVIKRMPGTGAAHRPCCGSYEFPASESGLGTVLGKAVIERAPDRVEVRLDFPLSHNAHDERERAIRRAASASAPNPRRLSIRGLVHLLWDRAGFNRWSPRMEGKRTWWVIRKHLLEAAAEIQAAGVPLARILFIPEPYRSDDAEALRARRAEFFAGLGMGADSGRRRLALLIGEVKDCAGWADGYRLTLKHLPDWPIALDAATGRRFFQRFETELLAKAQSDVRLVAACTVETAERSLRVDTVTLLMVTADWIPIDDPLERTLIAELVRQHRRFVKPLRYGAPATAVFAAVVLLDCGDAPVRLAVDRAGVPVDGGETEGWVWRPGRTLAMPPLPPPGPRGAARA